MSKDIEKGATVYDHRGREYEYLMEAPYGCGHLVMACTGDEREPYYESPETLYQVYTDPPKERIDGEVVKAQAKLDDLNQQILEASGELRGLGRDVPKRIEALRQRSAALRRIEECLDDKATHFVVSEFSGPEIYTVEEFAKVKGSYDRGSRKLLTLWGRTNGDLSWHLSKYSNGDGGDTVVIPCLSEEEAQEEVKKLIANADVTNLYRAGQLMRVADKQGLPFPDDIREAVTAAAIKTAKSNVDRHAKTLRDAEEALAKLATD